MKKNALFILVLMSCFFSLFAFFEALQRHASDSHMFQSAITNSNVSLKVNGGTLAFTQVPSPSMNAVDASANSQTTTGTLGTLEVTDLRGAKGTGWTVNLDSMTDYYNGDHSDSIPLADTELTVKNLSVPKGDPSFVSISGAALIPADQNGDKISDSAITFAQTQGQANGKKYSGVNVADFKVDLSLTVPGSLPADTYTSVYTVSVQ